MSSLTYDGHDFSTLFAYGDPDISILNAKPDLREVSGRDGAAFVGTTYGTSTVAFTIAAQGTAADRRAAFSTLGKWLDVDEPKRLVLPDTPDRFYLAVPNAPLKLERAIGAETAKVTFELTDPIAYGTYRSDSLASGGSKSITVGGTARTWLRIVANSAVRDSTSLVWGVKVDDADFVHVATSNASARKVEIDSQNRVCKVANALALPTLDSTWLELAPGSHTVAMDNGTGAAALYWYERWY